MSQGDKATITGTHRRTGGTSSRSKSVSIFQLQFEGGPQLKTAQQKQYNAPSIKKIEDLSLKLKDKPAKEALYMSPDGTFYDVNYIPVFKHKIPEKPHNRNNHVVVSEDDEEESFQQQLAHVYYSIPQIDEFENYFDYEQAFLGWKFALDTLFTDVKLPVSGGRTFYRPRVSNYQKGRDNSTFDTFRPSVSSFSNDGDHSEEKSDPLTDRAEDDATSDHITNDSSVLDNFELGALRAELLDNSDPWDSHLYPEEPVPENFESFEEYDEALIRWAAVCAQLPFFPPHAAQLKELIPIQSISEQAHRLEDAYENILGSGDTLVAKAEQLNKQTLPIKSGIYEVQFFGNRHFNQDNMSLVDHSSFLSSLLVPPISNINIESLEPNKQKDASTSGNTVANHPPQSPQITTTVAVKQKIHDLINPILTKRLNNMQTIKSYNVALLPRIHGILPPNLPTLQKPNSSLKNTHLRRTDLTPDQLKACQDAPARVGTSQVEFKIPIHDITIDFNRLKTDPSYMNVVTNQLRTIHSQDRNNTLASWYHPLVGSSTHQKHRDDIDAIITTQHRLTKDQINFNNISDILYGNMYMDKFSDLLDTSFSEDFDGGKSYSTIITKMIGPDNIDKLMQLAENSKSPLFQAKLSYLVMNLFSGNQGSPIIERLIQVKDVKTLSLLTYSFDYLSDLPIDLYPWSDEGYAMVKQVIGDSMDTLFKLTFCYYYLTVIARVLDIHVHLYYSKSIVTQSKVSLAHSMATLLQQNTPNILDKLFTGIRHRSSTVSSFCLFILLQLMHNQEGMAIHNCLKADSSFLFERIKKVADSKMKHVQFAARRLFNVISKSPWIDFIYKEYTKDPESSVRDFLGDEDHRPSNLLLELVSDFFTIALDRTIEAANASMSISNTSTVPMMPSGTQPPVTATGVSVPPIVTIGIKNKFLFVLDGMLYHTLLQFVLKHSKNITYQVLVISNILSKLSMTHCKLGTLSATQDVKTAQKKWGLCLLSLSPIDIRNLLSKINDFLITANPLSYAIRRNLLSSIRYLFKYGQVFDIIKKEEDFYSRLLSFCRDGYSSEFNREAWCLLYQIMKNHAGTMEHLAKDTLAGFLELVGTSSHTTVITNGLHYITKMFSITSGAEATSGAVASKKSKNDLKVIEKDMKALNGLFISKRLFIKIHMIYKKYINTQPGLAFIELAKFYNIMYTSTNCSKLFKDTIKKVEYKEGFEKIGQMFDPFKTDGIPSSGSDSPPTSSTPTSGSSTPGNPTPAPSSPLASSSTKSTVSSFKSMFTRSNTKNN